MATIRPFAALRHKPELAARICELPYDVLSSDEARELAAGNPLSFLHVSKPEIDLLLETNSYAPEVYRKGKENFERLIADGLLQQDPSLASICTVKSWPPLSSRPGRRCQLREILHHAIKKHELTRPDKEDDRVRHIETLNAQTGPVFLIHRATAAMEELASRKTSEPPDIDFTALDGVRHTSWTLRGAATIQWIESAFNDIPFHYIADGHHRCAAHLAFIKVERAKAAAAVSSALSFPTTRCKSFPIIGY